MPEVDPGISITPAVALAVFIFCAVFVLIGSLAPRVRGQITIRGHAVHGHSDVESLAADQTAARRHECSQHDLGEPWAPWSLDEARQCLSGTLVMRPGCCDAISGGVCLATRDAATVRVFDWHFTMRVGKGAYTLLHQTGAVVNSLPMKLPAMVLHPFDTWMKVRLPNHYLEEIECAGLEGYTAKYESRWSGEQFFRLEAVQAYLVPFVRDRNWWVEWTGDTLLISQLKHVVPVDQLQQMADDALIVAEVLNEASLAYTDHLDKLVERSIGS